MFTYDQYLDLVHIGLNQNKQLFLRHDVDISLQKALQMAEVEATAKLKSTYYILFSSPFYNPMSKENIEKIKMIKGLGMGIGIHYDLSIKDCKNIDYRDEILVQAGLLEHHVGPLEGMSVTFHRPTMCKSPDNELINIINQADMYSPDYDKNYKYISDSGHNWREDPVEAMMSNEKVHMNTHPIWYNDEEQTMEDCLHGIALDVITDRLINKTIIDTREYLEKINKTIP